MNETVRRWPGELHPLSSGTRNEALPAERHLHRDEWPAKAHDREERGVETLGGLAHHTHAHFDAVIAQVGEAPPLHAGVWVLDGYDRPANAGGNEVGSTRTGAARVVARF